MAFSICYWANYTQWKTKLSWKSENAVADDRVLKFLYDADLRHVESSVRCHRKYKNEWSHKSRSRIDNLYILTRPIAVGLSTHPWMGKLLVKNLSYYANGGTLWQFAPSPSSNLLQRSTEVYKFYLLTFIFKNVISPLKNRVINVTLYAVKRLHQNGFTECQLNRK